MAQLEESAEVQVQGSRVSIRPQRLGMNELSDRPNSAASTYSQFGARGGKFSSAKPKSDVDWAIYRAKQCPGPGEYSGVSKDFVPRGGRFNMSKPKSDIDWLIKKASEEPGPGDYRSNDKSMRPGGGKFSTARPKSALDWTIFNARQQPGPGHYKPDANYKVNGGRFSTAKPKSDVEWSIQRAKQMPGPGQYQASSRSLSGGKFNMSNPKSDVDWAILKAMNSPSAQDYNVDAHHKVVGGRFSTGRPKSALDWEIYRSKQMPGPGEYNAELQSIGRRAGHGYTPSTPSNPGRPKTAHSTSLPPEARGKVRPKGLNESSADSLYGVGNDKPKRPATATGIPLAARGKPKPHIMSSPSSAPAGTHGKELPPRAMSAPPGPRMVPSSPISRPETPAGKAADTRASSWRNPGDHHHQHHYEVHTSESRQTAAAGMSKHPHAGGFDPALKQARKQMVHVTMPTTRPGSVPPKKSNKVYVGEEPKVHRLQSNRPASALDVKPRPKTKTMATQASEEDMRLMERQVEEAEKKHRRAMLASNKDSRSASATGRSVSQSDLGSSEKTDRSRRMLERPAASAPTRVSKRIPKNPKNKIVYPMGVTRPAAVASTRSKLSDNARKLFDLAMQSSEFKKMMELYTGVKDPTDVIEKYAAMWSYQPLFEGRKR